MTDFAAIIVAAGTGSRTGSDIPKQYRDLNGRGVLRRTLDIFKTMDGCKEIRVVIHKDHRDLYETAISGLDLGQPVIGGATRQESVANAVGAMSLPDYFPVLIHDAARPFITPEIILTCVEKLETEKAVTVAIPVVDTLRRTDGSAVDRKDLWSVQTPQGFHFSVLKEAHEKAIGDYTDDAQMVSDMGIPVAIVPGSKDNIKITTEDDFKSMNKKVTKTGLGYDVHAFGEVSDKIRIGGIDIPHNKKLLGHSDADVVLHSITDSIYGTISSGDIGSHFPPSNNEFKNMDSRIFLEKAVEELKAAGGELIHIDTIIICEEPKIGPHRDVIREKIAEICGIPVKDVSVKATTSEGLGFTGRREGIACQSLVTIEIDR